MGPAVPERKLVFSEESSSRGVGSGKERIFCLGREGSISHLSKKSKELISRREPQMKGLP